MSSGMVDRLVGDYRNIDNIKARFVYDFKKLELRDKFAVLSRVPESYSLLGRDEWFSYVDGVGNLARILHVERYETVSLGSLIERIFEYDDTDPDDLTEDDFVEYLLTGETELHKVIREMVNCNLGSITYDW